MSANQKWGLAVLLLLGASVAVTWTVASQHFQAKATDKPDDPKQAEETVKIVVAFSQPLEKRLADRATLLLTTDELRLPNGKRIEVTRQPMTSQKMIRGTLDGSVKAHLLVPTSALFLDLAVHQHRREVDAVDEELAGGRTVFRPERSKTGGDLPRAAELELERALRDGAVLAAEARFEAQARGCGVRIVEG